MAASVEIRLKVPFHDLDPLMVVWHGNYMKYFDQARFKLFEAAGVDLYAMMEEKQVLFPITKTYVKHVRPLGPNEEFTCRATVAQARYKIVIDFEVRLPDGALCARCTSEQVAVRLPGRELEFEIPPEVRKALEQDIPHAPDPAPDQAPAQDP